VAVSNNKREKIKIKIKIKKVKKLTHPSGVMALLIRRVLLWLLIMSAHLMRRGLV